MALALAPNPSRPNVLSVLSSDQADLSILLEADAPFIMQTRAFVPYGDAGPGHPGRVAVPNGVMAALLLGPSCESGSVTRTRARTRAACARLPC